MEAVARGCRPNAAIGIMSERASAWLTFGRGLWRFRPAWGGTCVPERVWVISIARLVRYRTYTCDLSTSSSLTTLIWRSYLEGGFVLRCFQHLSLPDAATRRCSWRNNRHTGGLSNTVLSY